MKRSRTALELLSKCAESTGTYRRIGVCAAIWTLITTRSHLGWQQLSVPAQASLVQKVGGDATSIQDLASNIKTSYPDTPPDICRAAVEASLSRPFPSGTGQDKMYVWVDARRAPLSSSHTRLRTQQIQQDIEQRMREDATFEQQNVLRRQYMLQRHIAQQNSMSLTHAVQRQQKQKRSHAQRQRLVERQSLQLHYLHDQQAVERNQLQIERGRVLEQMSEHARAQRAHRGSQMLVHGEMRDLPFIMDTSGGVKHERVWVTMQLWLLNDVAAWVSSPEYRVFKSLRLESSPWVQPRRQVGEDCQNMEEARIVLEGLASIRANELVIELECRADNGASGSTMGPGAREG